MNDLHLVLHGLAIKKYATVEAIAGARKQGLIPFKSW